MQKQFVLENPKDTGDDRVTFIIRSNGTVLPGFIARASLIAIGGLTSNNIVALYTEHRPRIAEAVKRKLAEGKLRPYISLSREELEAAGPPSAPSAQN
jgi:hypothetical protein